MLYALHGFLGKKEDWSQLNLKGMTAIDLYDHPSSSLESFARAFNASITTSNNILIGYSMGGRLALHCLEAAPELWDAAVLISTHPGLESQDEKKHRIDHDAQWVEAFEKEPWDNLMERWNEQTVFSGHQVKRDEKNYSRQDLANSLRGWSLGCQKDFRPFLSGVDIPILWINGEQDQKFKALFRQGITIPDSGHRVLWENPSRLSLEIERFTKEVERKTVAKYEM